jgi:hypothetical protein
MKKILLSILFAHITSLGFSQQTYMPDDYLENYFESNSSVPFNNDNYVSTTILANFFTIVVNTPNTIVPIPIDDDYSIGFIRRYFVRKANDEHGFTYEIAKDEYAEYIDNPFWTTADIKWRITGPLNPTYKENGEEDDRGVMNSNKAAIGIAASKIKNIGLYLPNVLQFYK